MNEFWQATIALLSGHFLLIPLWQWLLFLLVTACLYVVLRIGLRLLSRGVERIARQTPHVYDDYLLQVLQNTRWFGILGVAIFLSLSVTALAAVFPTGLRTLALVLFFLQVGMWGNALIDMLLEKGFQTARFSDTTVRTASGVVRWFCMVLVWGVVSLLILHAFQVEITPLIATLGVGSIAVAFALQQILGDIFCSVAIVLDRPFEVGDFIIAGDYMGTVEQIGIKTTRVRSLGGEQIIFPNSDLLGSRVRNYKRMHERRVVFGFGVLYATVAEKLEQVPHIVRQIISGIACTRFDRAHFQAFGDSALQFEVVYYVLSSDYNLYMDIQQQINLSLLRQLQGLGVEMAFPSRTIYLDREWAALFRPAKPSS